MVRPEAPVKLSAVVTALLDVGEWLDGSRDPIGAGYLLITGDPDYVDGGMRVFRVSALARAVQRAAGAALPQASQMLMLLADVVPPCGLEDLAAARYAELQAQLREAAAGISPECLDVHLNY